MPLPAQMYTLNGFHARLLTRVRDFGLAQSQLERNETLVIRLLPQDTYRIICTETNWRAVDDAYLRTHSSTDFELYAVKR